MAKTQKPDVSGLLKLEDDVCLSQDMVSIPTAVFEALKDAVLHAKGQEMRDYAPRQRNIDIYQKALRMAEEI